MQWSKLRKLAESFFADCLQGRAIYATSTYRRAGHEAAFTGHTSLIIDKTEVLKAGTKYLRYWHGTIPAEVLASPETIDLCIVDKASMSAVEGEEWILRRPCMIGLLLDYCQLPIEEIVQSESRINRGLGMLDRRVGKKRLKEFLKSERDPFVQLLLCLRLQAESGRTKH